MLSQLRSKLKFKIKYHIEYEMDYGSSTKRFGKYILNDNNIDDVQKAKDAIIKLFNDENEESLKPYMNFTRGEILSKKFHVDSIDIIS